MNPKLLQSQFDRLARNPADVRLLKQLAVEFGSAVIRGRPEWLREYRVAAAAALRVIEKVQGESAVYARGVLCGLLDAAGCAEETLTAEQSREEVRSVASRPLHRQILRALDGRAQTTKAVAEQLGKQKSQVSEALQALEELGLVCVVVRPPQANQKEKPYRLTLTGALMLEELPLDESPMVALAPVTESAKSTEDKRADVPRFLESFRQFWAKYETPASAEAERSDFDVLVSDVFNRKCPTFESHAKLADLVVVSDASSRKRLARRRSRIGPLLAGLQYGCSELQLNSWDDQFVSPDSVRLTRVPVRS